MLKRIWNNFWRITLLLCFISIIAACGRGNSNDQPDIGLDFDILPNPPVVGAATLTLRLTSSDDQPITGAAIELEGNMNHAGMTPIFSQASEVSPGRYEAPLEFTMGGDWFILVKATLGDGSKLERQIDINGVQTQ